MALESGRRLMFWGLAVLLIGLILLLERLNVIEGGLLKYWPVLLIALGATMVVNWWRKKE